MTDAGTDVTRLQTEFVGTRKPLFWLALKSGIWTVLTLGIYRFWMKTKLRRWYWSSIRPGGLPLEYVGDPLEKLLGFLIVVVMMAFYIGIVNLILMFVSLSLLASSFTAYLISFVGVIPLWFFALYRMRRYVLARTRWRGVRFGLKRGAWGYAARSLWYWLLTIVSLGFFWPRMTFLLEKFKTDRTVFGSVTLSQGGHWTMLLPYFAHAFIGLLLTAAVFAQILGETDAPNVAWLLLISVPWLIIGAIYFRVQSVRVLAEHKRADGLALRSDPDTKVVLRIYVFGYTTASLSILVPLIPIVAVVGLVQDAQLSAFYAGAETSLLLGIPLWAWTALGALTWFAVFLMWSTLRHCFVTLPLWRHFAETLAVEDRDGLSKVSQRARDEFTEAEGFAEALDMGAAI